jgi:GDP-4-dehydro-6-deoxy-D-mannose reductase
VTAPLVTGGTGFAATHLIDLLLRDSSTVHAWANPGGKPIPTDGRSIQWTGVDIMDPQAVRDAIARTRPSVVYHCAGVADVAASWSTPARALKVNALGTHNLIEAVQAAGLDCPVLITGSALVYPPSSAPLSEECPVGPTSPYGLSKLAQEMVAMRSGGLRVLIARPFNHAGPAQSDAYVTSSFARQIAEAEAGWSPAVLKVGNLESRRDITDVRDTVRAYRLLIERGTPARPYNVCSGQAYRIRDLLEILVGMSRVQLEIRPDPSRMRPSDNPVVLGDNRRIRDEVGWAPQIPIEQTLADLLDYWRYQGRTSQT